MSKAKPETDVDFYSRAASPPKHAKKAKSGDASMLEEPWEVGKAEFDEKMLQFAEPGHAAQPVKTTELSRKQHEKEAPAAKQDRTPQPKFDDDSMTFVEDKKAEHKKAEEEEGGRTAPAATTTTTTIAPETTSSGSVTLEALDGAPGTTPGAAAVKGDPHLQNVQGEAFDVMQTGNMLLLEIPRKSPPETLDLAIRVDIDYLGAVQCGPTFITGAYMSGRWLGVPIDFRSGPIAKKGGKMPKKTFGIRLDNKEWIPHSEFEQTKKLSPDATIATRERKFLIKVGSLGVAVGQPKRPRVFLDVQVKGLQTLKVEIGGLLGIDDHSAVEKEPVECKVDAAAV